MTRQGPYLFAATALMVLFTFICTAPAQLDQPGAAAETPAETQLRINRDALLHGANEQIRMDAAGLLLMSQNPLSRRVLLNALRQSENLPPRLAVCKALSQARRQGRPIPDRGEFIEPLMEVLWSTDAAGGKIAAEALLMFGYEQLREPLEKLSEDTQAPVTARVNAIYALKLQLEMDAIAQIMKLLDDKDREVALAAEEALRSLGIPIGRTTADRRRIIGELRNKGIEQFQQDWLVSQEQRVAELEGEAARWRNLYLSSLNRLHDSIADDASKGRFLSEQLRSSEPAVRLWALDKVAQWRVGTQSKLPPELGAIVLDMISDENRQVRLRTARLLSLLAELSSAEKLLDRFKGEQDEEVKLELFVALGSACQYALLPNSGIQLSEQVRTETLELAGKYLADDNAQSARRGAEVIAKLLVTNSTPPETVARFLDLVAARYSRAAEAADGKLRAELMAIMAELCSRSAYRAEAAARFGSLFEAAMSDESDVVRQAAVEGLISIDKPRALSLLRSGHVDDRNVAIRRRLIDLAGEVGSVEDLGWLSQKLGVNSESGPAWQAMLKIFENADASVAGEWVDRLALLKDEGRLTAEQWGPFLEIVEKRAVGASRADISKNVRALLASHYASMGQYERAAEYLGLLRKAAATPEERDLVVASMVDVYLQWGNYEAMRQVIANRLLEKDLGPDDSIVRRLDAFFAAGPNGTVDPNQVIESLKKIVTSQKRPAWEAKLKLWQDSLKLPAEGRSSAKDQAAVAS